MQCANEVKGCIRSTMALASQIKEGRKRIQWEHRRENQKETEREY